MAVIDELIREEETGALSFGNFALATKTKKDGFQYQGDSYKIKTFREITKLERNGMFVYESVPGTVVHDFRATDKAVNFVVEGDVLICGYGFTAEPDYLYQINRNTGEIIDRLLLKKMPDLIVEQDGKLYVHTYSYNYVIEIE